MPVMSMFTKTAPEDVAGLRYAATLARRLDRPLRAVCALPDPAAAFAYTGSEFAIGPGLVAVDKVTEAHNELVDVSRAALQEVAPNAGLALERSTFAHIVGYPEQVAADEAILAEAIVFPRSAGKPGHGLSAALESTLMDNGQPVVVAGSEGTDTGGVLIAWDGSEQAARAVRLHAPLIARLGAVHIAQNAKDASARPGGSADRPERLQDWLSGQGISSEVHLFEGEVGKGLLRLADTLGVEMLVCGAYGHSRMGEFLFGGTTRTLLHAKSAPALALAH